MPSVRYDQTNNIAVQGAAAQDDRAGQVLLASSSPIQGWNRTRKKIVPQK